MNNLPAPSPSLNAFLSAYGRARFCASWGVRASFPRSSEVEGCTVSVCHRLGCRATITVSASDGNCVIDFVEGRALLVERASNLGSATALDLARRIVPYINAM